MVENVHLSKRKLLSSLELADVKAATLLCSPTKMLPLCMIRSHYSIVFWFLHKDMSYCNVVNSRTVYDLALELFMS